MIDRMWELTKDHEKSEWRKFALRMVEDEHFSLG